MYTPVKSTSRMLTPKEAKRFLDMNTFEGQRRLNPIKASKYANNMRAKTMRPVEVATAILPDGAEVLMNGQHVLTGIVAFDSPYMARVEQFKCETSQDAWLLFASFDAHAARTEGQIIKAARGLYADARLTSMPYQFLASCGSALFILGDSNSPKFHVIPDNRSEKALLVESHADEVCWVDQVFRAVSKVTNSRHVLERVGVMAAMIATYRNAPVEATAFWTAVGTGAMLAPGTPEFKLHLSIGKNSDNLLALSGTRRARNWYTVCIVWWNSFCTGERRSIVKLASITELPKVLAPQAKQPA